MEASSIERLQFPLHVYVESRNNYVPAGAGAPSLDTMTTYIVAYV